MCYDLHEGGWACHERLAIRVRIYVPMSVDTYVLDADDLAVSRLRANERSNRNRRHEPSLSTSTMQAAAGCTAAAARCAVRRRRAPRAPPYIGARCGRFGCLSRAHERSDSNRRHEPSLSTSTVHATAGRTAAAARSAVHRRRAPRAPPCRKALSVGKKWRELEFLTLENFSELPIPQPAADQYVSWRTGSAAARCRRQAYSWWSFPASS